MVNQAHMAIILSYLHITKVIAISVAKPLEKRISIEHYGSW